jgi:hypothetical protein
MNPKEIFERSLYRNEPNMVKSAALFVAYKQASAEDGLSEMQKKASRVNRLLKQAMENEGPGTNPASSLIPEEDRLKERVMDKIQEQNEADYFKNQLKESEAEVNDLSMQNAELEQQAAELKSENEQLQLKVQELEGQIQQIQGEKMQMQAQGAAAQQQALDANDQLMANKQQVQSYRDQILELASMDPTAPAPGAMPPGAAPGVAPQGAVPMGPGGPPMDPAVQGGPPMGSPEGMPPGGQPQGPPQGTQQGPPQSAPKGKTSAAIALMAKLGR